jgi:hypothetical protein
MTFREGGGHPGAAGGFLKTDVEKKGDSAAITEIECTLQNYFEELEAIEQKQQEQQQQDPFGKTFRNADRDSVSSKTTNNNNH